MFFIAVAKIQLFLNVAIVVLLFFKIFILKKQKALEIKFLLEKKLKTI